MQETIPFEICDAELPEKFLETYYPLAVNHQPPFSSNSDKGFKDALVVSTVRRFISENPTCGTVHLVTEDKRLTEAFENEDGVVVHQKLGSLAQPDNGQQNASAHKPQNAKPTVEKRNLDTQAKTEIEQAMNAFCESSSFSLTHSAIARLSPYKNLLSEDEKIRLLKAAATNGQISRILTDADVAEFMNPIFLELQYQLDDRQYHTYVESAELPNERLDENGNVQFSRVERQAYQSFSNNLLEHINSRSLNSSIETDADLVQSRLTDLLAASTLNPEQLSWKSISRIFIIGDVYVNDSVAHRDTILNFCNLLKQSNDKKRDALMQGLSSNLEMVDTTIDGSWV